MSVICFQLQMLGYDISWAAFNVIEVMSSTKFTFKVNRWTSITFNVDNFLHVNIRLIKI